MVYPYFCESIMGHDPVVSAEAQVVIAGDVCPVALGPESLLARLGLPAAPDLMVFTLDAAVAAGPPEGDTCIGFRPEDLAGLRAGRTTVAVTASNHLTDFGDTGVRATLEALAGHGLEQVGAGLEAATCERTRVIDLPGGAGRVAIVAFAETAPRVGARAAGPNKAGVRAYDEARCLEAIARGRREADWVWVVLHWGEEFVRYPDPEQRRAAWRMVDIGAALVVASHTHVPLGYERRGDATIFYGLGNFVYPSYRERRGYQYRWHPRARRGIVLQGLLAKGHWVWTPLCIRHGPDELPCRDPRGRCVDYAHVLPADFDAYVRLYPRLRKRERLAHLTQRLLFMSGNERVFRVRSLLARAGLTRSRGR